MTPPTEVETSAVFTAATEVLSPQAVSVLRRLLFERDRLRHELQRAREETEQVRKYGPGVKYV